MSNSDKTPSQESAHENSAAETPLCVLAFARQSANHPDQVNECTWAEFCEELESNGHARVKDKDDAGLFTMYALKKGTTRANANVESVYGWALDLDKASADEIDATLSRLDADGLAYLLYSTHGHSDKKWKLRIIGPLAAPVPGKEWPPVWRAIVDKYTARTSDESCKDVSRMYYWPSCPPDADEPMMVVQDGQALDVATLNVKKLSKAGAARGAAGGTSNPGGLDLNAKSVIDGAVRVERCPPGGSIFEHAERLCQTMAPSVSGNGGHVALLRVARALSWGLELDDKQVFDLLANHFNPRCEPEWSEAEIEHKIEAASGEDGAPYRRGALLPPPPPEGEPGEVSSEVVALFAEQHHSDSGNAERFSIMYGEDVRYCTPRKKWLRWTGQRWEWDERDHIVELAKHVARTIWKEVDYQPEASDARKSVAKHALYSESKQGLSNMLALAQSKCAVLPNELDCDPWLLNVRNGTLDLRTGELRDHLRADMMTKLAPVSYEPGASSDLWDACLKTFTGGDAELSAYLQRSIGLALSGVVQEKAFWFAYGEPDGGKSTFLNAVAAALGDYHVAADSETWLARRDAGGNRGDLVRLMGARLVTSSEFKPGGRFDVKLMKAITGGDPITAAAKYEGEITFQPAFSLWLAGNDAPTIQDDDDGMWRRVRRVPFTKPIPRAEQDPTMPAKLKDPAVAAAILAWAVQGCLEWQRAGLGTAEAVEQSNADYRREMDRLEPFFEECCTFDPTGDIPIARLRQLYEEWCTTRRVRAIGKGEFNERLEKRGCTQAQIGKQRTRSWVGIAQAMPG